MKEGGKSMATKSILKNVNITDKSSARKFISALENAQNKTSKTVSYTRTVKEVKGDDINKFFGVNKCQDIQE